MLLQLALDASRERGQAWGPQLAILHNEIATTREAIEAMRALRTTHSMPERPEELHRVWDDLHMLIQERALVTSTSTPARFKLSHYPPLWSQMGNLSFNAPPRPKAIVALPNY